ncbi:MAG TPA: ATP-binding protein [Candidatus Obscuribacterales bacterium]
MRLDLKVKQKGLLLVAIPLAFELVFVGTLVYLQQQAETAASRANHSKEVVRRAEVIVADIYQAGGAFALWGMSHSPALENRLLRSINKVPSDFDSLKELVRGDEEQMDNVRKWEVEAQKCTESLLDYKRRMEMGEATELGHFSRLEIAKSLQQLVNAGGAILKRELYFQKQHPEDEQGARRLVQICLLAGVGANILISIALANYFSRDITKRLDTIVDNTTLLAEHKPLRVPVEGKDEIAHLDQVFHKMAHELEVAAQKERAIIDNAQDVICALDQSFRFNKMSPAAKRLWGYDPSELIGARVGDLVADEDKERLVGVFNEARAKKNTPFSVDIRMTRKDGTPGWMLWSIYWSQQMQSYFCVAHDISERKILDQMKADFVSMISHDLRTPLTGMNAFLDTLTAGAYGALNDKGAKASERVKSSLVRLVNLVNDLLDIEKMEAGKMEMRFASVAVEAIVEGALDMVRGFAEQQKVSWHVEPGPDIELMADGDRMVQVVQNLLANAIKFSPQGGMVTVSWEVERASDSVLIKVSDQGRGIHESEREAIFDRFRQAKSKPDTPKGGTGLGLAICKAIVEAHHGEIGVESQEGKGSTFWFRLPCNEKQSKTA